MAISYQVLKNEPNGLNTRYVQAYLKDNGGNEIRLADQIIAIGDPVSSIDLQAAWNRGVVVPNGIVLWNQLELEATDDLMRTAILAFLDVVRANGSLVDMVGALEGVIDDDAKLLIAYNRIRAAFQAGSGANQAKLIAALTALTFYRLGQRVK